MFGEFSVFRFQFSEGTPRLDGAGGAATEFAETVSLVGPRGSGAAGGQQVRNAVAAIWRA